MKKILIILLWLITSQYGNTQIIADHSIIDDFDSIPAAYITEVKKMLFAALGESHSSGYRQGLNNLELINATYNVNESNPPETYTTSYLRHTGMPWGDLTHATGWQISYGEEDWFKTAPAIAQTKVGLKYYNDNNYIHAYIGFGWCYDPAVVHMTDSYLDATQQYVDYCAISAPNVTVYFTTGPVDLGNATGEQGYEKSVQYDLIRSYVESDPSLILFDYADILCYDSGSETPNTATWDGHTFPIITTANVSPEYGGHISYAGEIRLAKAIWWMLARIAGWEGVTGTDDLIRYVSPRGNDANAGTDTSSTGAWRTWHYAFNNTPGGGTCYFLGGTYPPYSTNYGAKLEDSSQDGTHDNPTRFFAYPSHWAVGNYPVMDLSTVVITGSNFGITLTDCHNIYFKGLWIKNLRQGQVNPYYMAYGWDLNNTNDIYGKAPNNIRFENCVAHHIGGKAFQITVADTVYFINCDAYMCCDSLTVYDPGGAGVGFGLYNHTYLSADSSYTYLQGCRAWKCSDQGYEYASPARTVWDSCFAINNGNFGIGQPKGSGWKFSLFTSETKNINVVQVELYNCLAVDNAYYGINWTDWSEPTYPETRTHIYNNFIYRNGKYHIPFGGGGDWTGGFGISDAAGHTDTTGQYDHWYWNNISYGNYGTPFYAYNDRIPGVYNELTNKFDLPGTTITNADFVSLDTTGLCGARQTNGELPITTFGHLSSISECINTGTDVGIPYNGSAPDIGWIEYESEVFKYIYKLTKSIYNYSTGKQIVIRY